MTVDVEALSTLYLGPIEPTTPPWLVRRQLDRYVAALHGASPEDVTAGHQRAVTALGDPELVAQAFAAIWPRLSPPELSPPAPTATAPHPPEPAGELSQPELSPLCWRILGRLSPGAAITRRELHRGLQRHVDGVDELDAALAELAARGRIRLAGEGSRTVIEPLHV